MKIFVFEFVTGGGYAGQSLPAFTADGECMWRALVDDLTASPGTEVLTLRDARLALVRGPGLTVVPTNAGGFHADFARCLKAADAAWIVAPESGGLLESLNRQVLAAGTHLLGCRPETVHLAGSKIATAVCLAKAGIPPVPTFASADLVAGPVVVKPDDGAGCEDTLWFADASGARAWQRMHPHATCVFQPHVAGPALSLSLLCCDGRAQLLSVNRQQVAREDDRFVFRGVDVNAIGDTDGRYAALATRIAEAMPGLWGYVGIDLIDGVLGPLVLEINPRVTVSYAGLREALGDNPAARVLALPEMHPLPRTSRNTPVETAHACVG